ncbi:uncharacterized protein [Apostichopus japonicus]|uniref:uncharacterized protein n=1 Tax=Stichopus japonicus TaxID=307972 RepID=UPI003AB86E65
MLYRPHFPFGLTLDVSAACDVARAFETMIAALYWCLHYQTPSGQTIPLVHFGYFGDFKPVLVDETIFVDNEQYLWRILFLYLQQGIVLQQEKKLCFIDLDSSMG